MVVFNKPLEELIDVRIKELNARIAELERANAELSRDAKRWKTCERLACIERERWTEKWMWAMPNLEVHAQKSFADAIDGEGV